MSFFTPTDEFSRVKDRSCAECGGTAICHRISSFNGATTYSFQCTGCSRTFNISGLVSLIAAAFFGSMMLLASTMLLLATLFGTSRSQSSADNPIYILAGMGLAGVGLTALFVVRVRTARKNPKIKAPTLPRATAHVQRAA